MPTARTPKRAKTRPYSEMTKSLGLSRADAFRRADLTPELRRRAGLTPTDEHRLTACAELSRLGLPLEAAQALSLSGAIGSASELAALSLAEVERLVAEVPVRRLLPEGYKIDRTELEDWMRRAVPLTVDETAPGRTAVEEGGPAPFAREEDPLSLADEDVVLTSDRLATVLTTLNERWARNAIAIEALIRPGAAAVEDTVLRDILADLQGGIASALDAMDTPRAGAVPAADEASTATLGDESLDPAVKVGLLQVELSRIEASIGAMRSTAATGSEETSPATATEAGPNERETSPRAE
jgi:hypothetical protein